MRLTAGAVGGMMGTVTRALRPLLALALLAGPAAAQTNAERILSEADTRSHDYDLVHQRIEVSGAAHRRHSTVGDAPRGPRDSPDTDAPRSAEQWQPSERERQSWHRTP